MRYLPLGKQVIKETDIADNLLLPNHHLFKNIDWYSETKVKVIILSACIHPSLYTNISEMFY